MVKCHWELCIDPATHIILTYCLVIGSSSACSDAGDAAVSVEDSPSSGDGDAASGTFSHDVAGAEL